MSAGNPLRVLKRVEVIVFLAGGNFLVFVNLLSNKMCDGSLIIYDVYEEKADIKGNLYWKFLTCSSSSKHFATEHEDVKKVANELLRFKPCL